MENFLKRIKFSGNVSYREYMDYLETLDIDVVKDMRYYYKNKHDECVGWREYDI